MKFKNILLSLFICSILNVSATQENKTLYIKLLEAISLSQIDQVEKLVKENPDLSCLYEDGHDILWDLMDVYPVYKSEIEPFKKIFNLLVSHKVDLNYQNYSGNTTLHRLANRPYSRTEIPFVFDLLLKNGANPCLINKYGKTAANIAEFKGNTALSQFLNRKEDEWQLPHSQIDNQSQDQTKNDQLKELYYSLQVDPTTCILL